MTDKSIDLDRRRGMEAQKATDLRRLLAEVKANERALRLRQDELEAHLAVAPAANREEAAEKARYVLDLYAATLTAEDTRRRTLVAAVLEDRSASPARSDPGTRRLLPLYCLSGPRRLASMVRCGAPSNRASPQVGAAADAMSAQLDGWRPAKMRDTDPVGYRELFANLIPLDASEVYSDRRLEVINGAACRAVARRAATLN